MVMGLCYLQMGRKLWGEKTIGEDTPSLAKSRKTKQKVIINYVTFTEVNTQWNALNSQMMAGLYFCFNQISLTIIHCSILYPK